MILSEKLECVLFDLDGTLVDTAPDFIYVLNKLLVEQKRTPIHADEITARVSNGASALIKYAFEIDHKHQDLSIDDEKKGLSRMSTDIIKTFIKKLATQGHSFSREKFRSLKATYYRSALDLIDIYRSDAQMNGLKFDSHTEEKAVELFAINIMKAGEAFYLNPMDTPFIPTWSRVKSAIPDFLDRLQDAVNEDNKQYI